MSAHEKATPRPWKIDPAYISEVQTPGDRTISSCWHEHAEGQNITVTGVLECSIEESAANAALIVEAVNSFDALTAERDALRAENEKLRASLQNVLRRDEQNTCMHEETHRGGYLWEICDQCGSKWADDEGGKPKWVDPPEWVEARALLHGEKA